MAVVKLKTGDEIEDRRKNGARLKLQSWDWIRLIGIVITAIYGYAHLSGTTFANAKTLDEHKTKIRSIEIKEAVMENNIIGIKDDIKEIKDNVQRIVDKVSPDRTSGNYRY